MTIQTIGAHKRPTLSLNYAAMSHTGMLASPARRSPTLSKDELRRLVAAMVD